MRRGFTLVELLVTVAVLALLLAIAARSLSASALVERRVRPEALLADEASLLASALSRELFVAGYGMNAGDALGLQAGGTGEDTLLLRYACEAGMEGLCFAQGVGKTKAVRYRVESGALVGGICFVPAATGLPACGTDDLPPMGRALEGEVEAFRVAYRAPGGGWTRGNRTVTMASGTPGDKVAAVAVYIRLKGKAKTGARAFTPGASLAFPDGLSLSTFGLSNTALTDGYPRAERLVVTLTPNLGK
ncbi:MAG: prepilin-type N-terminal cleavage/methylation domain-containing protein [Thermus sp.]|uniref:prepilin-type N-terminal cleavage/methylation domain-containing protein n=1 Tax=Thermus sp. TaxID=275 RepID=UPI00351B7529